VCISLIDFSLVGFYFSIDENKDERIELENLLKIEDLETLRIKGFVCRIYSKSFLLFFGFI
jgi:hypothetical protein